MHRLLLFAARSPAEEMGAQVGYLTALVGVPMLLLVGILKCRAIARRPTASAKSAYALALVLTVWLSAILAGQAVDWPNFRIVAAMVILMDVALVIASIVLAILGLAELADRQRELRQGKWQATWALVLSVGFLGLVSAGVYQGATERFGPESEPLAHETHRLASEVEAEPVWGETGSMSERAGPRFEELNFEFSPPSLSWTQMDSRLVNEDATLVYRRLNPDVSFMIIAEAAGVELGMDTPQLVELSKNNLRNSVEAEFLSEAPQWVGGLKGTRFESRSRLGRLKLAYVHWVCYHNGFLYQLITWGREQDVAQVNRAAGQLTSGFRLLDRERIAHTGGLQKAIDLRSVRYGIDVRLEETPWVRWGTLSTDQPDAELGALQNPHAAFCVIPVSLLEQSPRFDALAHALLARLGFSYPDPGARDLQEVEEGALSGISFRSEATAQGAGYLYQFKILTGERYAYLLAAWVDRSRDDGPAMLEDVLSRVRIREPLRRIRPEFLEGPERMRHAEIFNEIGLKYHAARQYAASAEYFRLSFEIDRESPIRLSNFAQALIDSSRYQEAREALAPELERFGEEGDLQATYAWLLAQLGEADEAIERYGNLFRGDYQDDDHFTVYADLLEGAGEGEQALEAARRYRGRSNSLTVAVLEARLLSGLGRHEDALDLLTARRSDRVFQAEVAYALVDVYRAAERYQEALATAEELIARGYESAETQFLKGTIEYDLKWYRQAKESFEKAARASPANPTIQEFLAHVSGLLGEGENTSIKAPIEPVPFPAAVHALPRLEVSVNDQDAYYRLFARAIRFEADRVYSTTEYQTIQVLTAAGVSQFSTLQFSFDPLSEQIFVNRLDVFDEQGTTVASSDVSDFYVVDDGQSEMASQTKLLQLPVAGLKPGYRIEVAVTRKNLAAPTEIPFEQHLFSAGYPVLRSVFSVGGELEELAWKGSPGLDPHTTGDATYWLVENPAVFRWEPLQDLWYTYLPTVSIADRRATWESVAREYLGRIEDRLPVSDEVRAEAERISAGATDETGKLPALVKWLQRDFTYKAIEFGRRAQIMNPAPQTIRNKYGDCKDHSLLFAQLVQSLGVPAHLALVNVSGPVKRELPSLDQFDHMIVYCPTVDGGRFFDLTDKDLNPALPVPYGLAGSEALVLDPDAPRFVRIPDYPADSGRITATRTVEVEEGSDLSVDETLVVSGYPASVWRSLLKEMDAEGRRGVVQGQIAGGNAEIRSLEIDGLRETEHPLTLAIRYRCDNVLHPLDGHLTGRLPSFFETALSSSEFVERRHSPFRIRFPTQVEATTRLLIPDGYDSLVLTPSESSRATQFGRWSSRTRGESAAVTLIVEHSYPAGRYVAEDYAEYHRTMRDLRRAFRPNIVVRRGSQGGRP